MTAFFEENEVEALLVPMTFAPPPNCVEGEQSFGAGEEALREAIASGDSGRV